MSTKFSVRPAPRKRPWTCKRSPPCLLPPPLPPTLLVTFYLKKIAPPPTAGPISGSFLVYWTPVSTEYAGSWGAGPDFYDFRMDFPLTFPTQAPSAVFSADGEADAGIYTHAPLSLPPPIYYTSGLIFHTTFSWVARLLITS